jgi:hypothetical protein
MSLFEKASALGARTMRAQFVQQQRLVVTGAEGARSA